MSATELDPAEGRSVHGTGVAEAFAALSSNQKGLSSTEAEARLEQYGANLIIRKQQAGPLLILWRQINNPLIWVLLVSGTLAILLGKLTDGLVVLAVVVINAIIGFVQEYRAEQAICALSEMVPQNATVVREGKNITIAASELVPGDVVLLAAGDSVPADMRLLQAKNLRIEEAALTGESVAVGKDIQAVAADAPLGDRRCMAYSGTLVTSGTGKGLVSATGMQTELGRISDLLDSTVDLATPLTLKLQEITKYITIAVLLISAVILAVGVKRALDQGIALAMALKDTLIFAIALAVGAIPEGLPAVVTIALAIGVQRMARRKAIIRKLPAVETLGSTTVICSDKTGTLTRNEMMVTELYTSKRHLRVTGSGYEPAGDFIEDGAKLEQLPDDIRLLLESAALCNDACLSEEEGRWVINGDPTEAALVVAAVKAGLSMEVLQEKEPRTDEIPFTSENKYMATQHGSGEATKIVVKGAPEMVLQRCLLPEEQLEEIKEVVRRMGSHGIRVLAVAAKQQNQQNQQNHTSQELTEDAVQDGLEFIGLVGMIDPPRTESIEAIKRCHRAGIQVKMITGDHHATAFSIGKDLGLAADGDVAYTGTELAAMSDAELWGNAEKCNIFARVAPEHKLRLVTTLQQRGHIVAMTGDGVNDAPALKQANIGVAMGITGTAVSKDASDIVLADDNFASISAAVEEGRRVYDNLIKSLAFLLPTNLGLAFILIYGIIFLPFDPITKALLLPMQPAQLLWINLVAAVTLALPLAFEAKESNIMNRPPRQPNAPLFSPFVVFRVVMVSILMTVGTVALFSVEYYGAIKAGVGEAIALKEAQTMAVTFVIMFQIFYMVHCRSLKDNLLTIGLFSNPTVFVGIGAILVLHLFFVYWPLLQQIFGTTALSAAEFGLAAAAAFAIFPLVSLEKWIRNRMQVE